MQKWEYLFTAFRPITGRTSRTQTYLPYEINGEPVEEWQNGERECVYVNQLGREGWELINSWIEENQTLTMIFKKPQE